MLAEGSLDQRRLMTLGFAASGDGAALDTSSTASVSLTVARRYRLGPMRFMPSFGAAYDGFDLDAQQPVTVWLLPKIRPSLAKLFFDQQASAAQVLPNLTPKIRDHGIDVATANAYVVFAPLRGRRLADALLDCDVPRDYAVRTFVQLVESLDQASAAGVVHGRLNPRNILVSPEAAQIIGFGLSYIQRIGSLPATLLPYLAPEQLDGHTNTSGSDLYAVALILYSCLVGESSFASVVPDPTDVPAYVYRMVEESRSLDARTRKTILALLTSDAPRRFAAGRRIVEEWQNGANAN